jgi:molybdenum cofactor guanylyltransferase
LLDKSAIILAGGSCGKFGEDKGTLKLDNKPLIRHVFDAVKGLVEEVIVVVDTKEKAECYAKILPPKTVFAIDTIESKGPLIGALTGLAVAQGKYSLLLAVDTPFVSKEVLSLLLDCAAGKTAVIPRSPDNQIEPLQAVYHTEIALETAREEVNDGAVDMQSMVEQLRGIRYISTMVIEQIDPEMRTFLNVNTPLDFKKAESLLTKSTKPKRPKQESCCSQRPNPPLFIGSTDAEEKQAYAGACWFMGCWRVRLQASLRECRAHVPRTCFDGLKLNRALLLSVTSLPL